MTVEDLVEGYRVPEVPIRYGLRNGICTKPDPVSYGVRIGRILLSILINVNPFLWIISIPFFVTVI
jgi:hypothetical protein